MTDEELIAKTHRITRFELNLFGLSAAAWGAIFGGVGAGTAVGNAVYTDVNKPSTPTTPTLPQAPSITPQQMSQAQQSVAGSGANAQASTGQGLSPSAQAALVDQLYGTPG